MPACPIRSPLLLTCMFAVAAQILPAQPLGAPPSLEFLPPPLAERDLCNAPPASDKVPDLEVEGDDEELTDRHRIRFLTRDIRNYMRRDADRYFDFIDALITARATIDPDYAGADETFARIEAHLSAGRLEALHDRALVPGLVARSNGLSNKQAVQLAQFVMNGIGMSPDASFAQSLIREAAFDGNAHALLEIARMEIQGTLVQGWDAPLDLTVTMAFGGMLGELNRGVCSRAERIAQEYLKGDVVAVNPDIAQAWRRFAADMGGAEAAWRVVEYHLSAPSDRKDNAEMRRYLNRAAALGLTLSDKQADRVASSGAVSAEDLEALLGFNHSNDGRRARRSVIPLLDMTVNLDGLEADEDGLYLDYLWEITQLPHVPGHVYTRLAREVSVREGRWKAEPRIMELLETAVQMGDEEGMQMLAQRLIRYRDDPRRLNLAENLLLETVWRHEMASSMDRLDALYRCQVTDAPRMDEAGLWAANYRASTHGLVTTSATDLIALDPYKDPETIARIQSRALEGRTGAVADHAQRIQSGAIPSDGALRFWADRLDRSDQALEAFAELEFELATTPAERAQAVEFFRRVYINNGVTTALDLAVALIEDHGRDPDIAREVEHLLTMAANRGEGASIRLLARLLARTGQRSEAETYAAFADVIEERGDFLALIFAVPYLPDPGTLDDYIDRAVSLMNCGTKDADELGDAYALWQMPQMSYHWRRVGLQMDGGHVLAKLRLSDAQLNFYDKGVAPSARDSALRAAADGEPRAHRRLFVQAADADLVTYDPPAAAGHVADGAAAGDTAWALHAFRVADPAIREIVAERTDMAALYLDASEAGDAHARFELGMLLRDLASGPEDLARSAGWLMAAANAGHDEAMVELGFALGFGLGVARDAATALDWLDRASAANHPRAEALADLIRVANR